MERLSLLCWVDHPVWVVIEQQKRRGIVTLTTLYNDTRTQIRQKLPTWVRKLFNFLNIKSYGNWLKTKTALENSINENLILFVGVEENTFSSKSRRFFFAVSALCFTPGCFHSTDWKENSISIKPLEVQIFFESAASCRETLRESLKGIPLSLKLDTRGWSGTRKPENPTRNCHYPTRPDMNFWPRVKPDPTRTRDQTRGYPTLIKSYNFNNYFK